jgi:hypothetical protein
MDYRAILELNSHGLIIEFHQESDENKGQRPIFVMHKMKGFLKMSDQDERNVCSIHLTSFMVDYAGPTAVVDNPSTCLRLIENRTPVDPCLCGGCLG